MNPVSNTERAEPSEREKEVLDRIWAIVDHDDAAIAFLRLHVADETAEKDRIIDKCANEAVECEGLIQSLQAETAELRAQLEAKEHELRTVRDLDASVVADLRKQLEAEKAAREDEVTWWNREREQSATIAKLTASLELAQGDKERWIPVGERLPKHLEWVWFYRAVGSGDVMRGQFVSDERACFASSGHRYWHPSEHVTHWMLSPTPVFRAAIDSARGADKT